MSDLMSYKESKIRWQLDNPEYFKQWRLGHPRYSKTYMSKYNREHPDRPNGNNTRTPDQWRAQSEAEKIPLAVFCELCPEDDKQPATQRHHPDYDFPAIFVSCCGSCHNYVEKGRD